MVSPISPQESSQMSPQTFRVHSKGSISTEEYQEMVKKTSRAKKMFAVTSTAFVAFAVGSVIAASTMGVGLIPIALAVGASVCAPASLACLVNAVFQSVRKTRSLSRAASMSSHKEKEHFISEELKKKEYACDMLPTEHSADTNLWRNELIKKAQHNIVISGNYCGDIPIKIEE